MIDHRTYGVRNRGPALEITAVGLYDVWKTAFLLCHGEVEHRAVGRAAFRYLRARLGRHRFEETDRKLTGGKVVQLELHRKARETN